MKTINDWINTMPEADRPMIKAALLGFFTAGYAASTRSTNFPGNEILIAMYNKLANNAEFMNDIISLSVE